ncbi:hypothetical protein [Streptomyces ossamyceticus]|uniref:hypothetical protein n=1 Tax=Streptomyces ossamyceticus TaxID=249581 RepID=UPI0006E21E55|nr:hypothetical protein [Streptomyces ossamyceticus]
MSDAPHRTSYDAALDAVRGYAYSDAVAVREALAGLDARSWTEVYAALGGLLRSTVGIMELTGRHWKLDDLVRYTDEVSAAAPPHYEFAMAEATRAWARGDQSVMRALSGRDIQGAVHMSAIGVAVLGLALWGRSGLLAVLQEFRAAADTLAHNPSTGG